jgi:hypothetical protein
MPDPSAPDEWLTLAAQHERIARFAAESKTLGAQAHFHVGLGVECALKAYIMRRERFNRWPYKASRPDLHVHDLRKLAAIAGISIAPTSPIAGAWKVVMDWDRNQGYDPKPMPRRVARSWVEAAFGPEGVVSWIRMQSK